MNQAIVTVATPAANSDAQAAADAAALQRLEGGAPTNPAPAAPAQPQLLAGKYKTPEDLEKAYKEVQAEANRLRAQLKKPTPVESPTSAQPTPVTEATPPPAGGEPAPSQAAPQTLEIQQAVDQQQQVEQQLESKGLSFDEFAASYAKNGKLTDEDLSKLEKAGISRPIVETYIRGVEALREQETRQGYEIVGGESVFRSMAEWASRSLSAEQIQAYNEAVSKGGESKRLALVGLKATWAAQQSTQESSLVNGVPATVGDAFQSIRELSKAQTDPRYGKDPAYTREVEAKAARSRF